MVSDEWVVDYTLPFAENAFTPVTPHLCVAHWEGQSSGKLD